MFWTHRRAETTRFLKNYEKIFTTRSDGKGWPRWKDTWAMAARYNQALLSLGRKKSMQRIARRVNVNEDRVEQLIRGSSWEHERLQVHLNTSMPDLFRSKDSAFVVDEIGNSQVADDLICVVPGSEYNANQLTWPLGMEI